MFTTKKLYTVIFFLGLIFTQIHDTQATENPEFPLARFDKIKKWYQYYSEKLGVQITPQDNRLLVQEIFEWMGTPYHYGRSSKDGADCSGFVGQVYQRVYDIQLQRNTSAIFAQDEITKIDTANLKMGDLLFFGSEGKRIEHIGIYLKDGKFVHSSSLRKRGVIVARFNSNYHTRRFIGAGRHIDIVREELYRKRSIQSLFVSNQIANLPIPSLASNFTEIEAPKVIEIIPIPEESLIEEIEFNFEITEQPTLKAEEVVAIVPEKIIILNTFKPENESNHKDESVILTKGILIR